MYPNVSPTKFDKIDTSQRNPNYSLTNPIKATFYSSTTDKTCSVGLVHRISTRTFDAIHRSLVFESWLNNQKVIVKICEISRAGAGEQMLEM